MYWLISVNPVKTAMNKSSIMLCCPIFAFSSLSDTKAIDHCTYLCLWHWWLWLYYRINLLLEIVASACLMYYYLYNGGCFFDGQYLLLPGAHESYISLSAFVKSHIATSYNTVCMAVFLLCLLIFAVINHPGFRLQNKALVTKEERYIIVLRSCFFALPFLAAVLLRYF